MIHGDFNAKIIEHSGDTYDHIGPNFLKGNDNTIQNTAFTTLDNRVRFFQYLIDTDTYVCNTKYVNNYEFLITFKPPGSNTILEPP